MKDQTLPKRKKINKTKNEKKKHKKKRKIKGCGK